MIQKHETSLIYKPLLLQKKYVPVIVDPSHASGRDDIIEPMSLAAMISGADGLEIEAHTTPKDSPSDASQTITLEALDEILNKLKNYNLI